MSYWSRLAYEDRAMVVCFLFAAAIVLYLYLSTERERILDKFIEAVQLGTLAVTQMASHQVAGTFSGHWFRMGAGTSDRGDRLYALSVKSFTESVRIGPFSYGSGSLGGYALGSQNVLANQFNRVMAQARNIRPDPDQATSPFDTHEL